MDNNKSGVIVLEGQNLSTINSNTSLTNNPSGDTGIPNTPIVGNDNVNSNVGTLNIPVVNDINNAIQVNNPSGDTGIPNIPIVGNDNVNSNVGTLNIPVVNDTNNAIQNNGINDNTISVDASSIVPANSSATNTVLNIAEGVVSNLNNNLETNNTESSTNENMNQITSIIVDNSSDEVKSDVNNVPVPNDTILSIDTLIPPSRNSSNSATANINSNDSTDGIVLESSSDIVNEINQNVNVSISDDGSLSVKKYLGYMFLFLIPIYGQIMLFIKAFDKKDKAISNYAKAQAIVTISLFIIFSIITFIICNVNGISISDIFHRLSNNYSFSYN